MTSAITRRERLRPDTVRQPTARSRIISPVARRIDDAKRRGEVTTGIISTGVAALFAVLLLFGRELLGDTCYYTIGWSCVVLLVGQAAAHLIAPLLPPTTRF